MKQAIFIGNKNDYGTLLVGVSETYKTYNIKNKLELSLLSKRLKDKGIRIKKI